MIKRLWDVTLTVTDLRRSVDFYENILGLDKKYQFTDYAGFDCSGMEIGLKTWGGCGKPRDGEPCLDFLVENVDDFYSYLVGKGIKFSKEPTDTPWGARIAVFRDPDGNTLQITQIDWSAYLSACTPK